MRPVAEAPHPDDLDDYPVAVETLDQSGGYRVRAWANDGSEVVFSWDVTTGSAGVRWEIDGEERGFLSRELVSKISVSEEKGAVEFWIWFGIDGLKGQLVVSVGDHVRVSDSVLEA